MAAGPSPRPAAATTPLKGVEKWVKENCDTLVQKGEKK
jgi:hypothetical protein